MNCEECGGVDIATYFESVPRSMLTVFRFFFGDFSTVQGVNIYEGIQIAYGTLAGSFVCVVFFVVSIGVFNVITAIFVESTLKAAQHLENTRLVARLNDPDLWAKNIEILIRKLFEKHGMPFEDNEPIHPKLKHLANEPVVVEEFQEFIKDKLVLEALDDLEIDGADHKYLFDILDADNAGDLSLSEFIDGVRRLRGIPRRSDIIRIDLMAREMQENIHLVVEQLEAMNSMLSSK